MTDRNPFDTLQQVAGGFGVSRCLHAVANLGIADLLGDAPRTAAELAGDAGLDANALHRVLRLLSTEGIFELRDGGIAHTPASRLLRSDHPHSLRAFVRMIGMPVTWKIYGALEDSVRSGRPATDTVLPDGFWSHYVANPENSRIFNEAMQAKAQGHVPAILAHYDFAGFASVADIGGGRGHLLRAIVDASPATHGVLFDLPRVIEEVAALASPRITLQGGDFFKDDLPTCAAYVAMDIIHDWDDDRALAILKAIRRAAAPGAKLLLMETMVAEDATVEWGKMLDIHMMVLLGGRQRTRAEYATLLDAAGFALMREIDTHAGISILEADTA